MIKIEALLSLVCFALSPAALSGATVVNVDLSRNTNSPLSGLPSVSALYSGVGIAPDAGTFWNDYSVYMPSTGGTGGADSIVNPYTVNNLTASDGSTITSIGLSLSSGWYRAFNAGSADNDLQQEWVYATGGATGVATLTGLTANGEYNLYMFASGNKSTTYTIGDTSLTATGAGFLKTIGDPTVGEGIQYVTFNSVFADENGDLSFNVTSSSGADGVLAGLQIEAVPEPSASIILIGSLAGLGLILRRQR